MTEFKNNVPRYKEDKPYHGTSFSGRREDEGSSGQMQESPFQKAIVTQIKEPITTADYEELYRKLSTTQATIGKFVQRWKEIKPPEVDEDQELVNQAASHLRAIREGLARLGRLDGLAESTAQKRTAAEWQPMNPLITDGRIEEFHHLNILTSQEARALEGLREHRDPLVADLNNHIAAVADVHPNIVSDALSLILTDQEKEEIKAKRQAMLDAEEFIASTPNVTDSLDQSFREWATNINNVGTKIFRAGSFIPSLRAIKSTLINTERINFGEKVNTRQLDDIVGKAALVTVFGKRVHQEMNKKLIVEEERIKTEETIEAPSSEETIVEFDDNPPSITAGERNELDISDQRNPPSITAGNTSENTERKSLPDPHSKRKRKKL